MLTCLIAAHRGSPFSASELRRTIPPTSPVFRSCQWQFSIMRWFQEQRTPYTIGEILLHLIGLGCMIMVAVSFTQLESIILQEQRYASCCLPSACSYSFASVQQAAQSLNILEGGICGPISRADALAMECEGELFGGHSGLVSTCIVNRRITSLKATTESEVEIEMQDICSRGRNSAGFWQAIFVAVWTGFVILTLALRFCCCIPGYFWLLLMGFGIATFVGIGFLVQLRSEKGYMEYEYKSSVGISCHGQWNEDASFILTVLAIYLGSVSIFTGSPNLKAALQSRWNIVLGSRDNRRMHPRRDSVRAWATIVTFVSELYFAFVACMRLFFPDRFVKPLYKDLQTWCCLAFLCGLRWTCRPNGHMSKWCSRCVTVMFNVVSVLATMDIPKEILPVSAVSRGAHGFFTDDPLFTVAVRFACIPLNVFCHFLREDDSDKYMGCFLVVVNEVIACICMAITLLEVDSALCKQEQAAMDLEKQIQKRELDMKENEKVLLGARRLLSVTCDCCERLSHDWQIVGPSQSTLGFLHVRDPVMSRLPFLQFICPEDHQRFTDFAEVSHTTDAPSSLHVRMQRSDSSHFEAQIFLVNLPGTSIGEGRPEYLIGLAASDPSERLQGINMMSIPENSPLQKVTGGSGGGNFGCRERTWQGVGRN
eukprot:symbB.v1.2.016311.t1/scaffold1148.1/size135353/1